MTHFSKTYIKSNFRHVLGLSGGKDSSALAIYLKLKYPEIFKKLEFFFSDTGAELKEVYEYLDKLEVFLGTEIKRLNSNKSFDDWLEVHNNYLPSAQQRWCTRMMKIKPFEEFVGQDNCVTYIGIRADENRKGYISQKDNIKAVFPFIDDRLVLDDVYKILNDSIGMPEYYKWRTRSGCYFCFFQRHSEWLGLKRNHPELFEKAKEYEQKEREKFSWSNGKQSIKGRGYSWNEAGNLDEIVRKAEEKELKNKESKNKNSKSSTWQNIIADDDEDFEESPCFICHK